MTKFPCAPIAISASVLHHVAFDGTCGCADRCPFSIKAVAPALLAGFGYADLDMVADGGAAAAALVRLAAGMDDADEASRLRVALLRYCERDTLAMVELHRALHVLGAKGRV